MNSDPSRNESYQGGDESVGGTPYWSAEGVRLFLGDCTDVMRDIPDNSVDAIVTDPPYG
jgi:hypothetical protein